MSQDADSQDAEPHPVAAVPRAAGALPGLGHIPHLLTRPLEFLAGLHRYGELVEIRLGPTPVYVACGPAATHRVLTDTRVFDKGGPFYETTRAVFGESLPTCPDADHRWQRPQLQPAFRPDRIDEYGRVMAEEAAALAGTWQPGGRIEIGRELRGLAMRVLARTLFSCPAQDRAVEEVQRSLPVLFGGIFRRVAVPVEAVHHLPTRGNRRYRLAEQRMRQAVERLLVAHRTADRTPDDLVSLLLRARHPSGRPLTTQEIHDHLLAMLRATEDGAGAPRAARASRLAALSSVDAEHRCASLLRLASRAPRRPATHRPIPGRSERRHRHDRERRRLRLPAAGARPGGGATAARRGRPGAGRPSAADRRPRAPAVHAGRRGREPAPLPAGLVLHPRRHRADPPRRPPPRGRRHRHVQPYLLHHHPDLFPDPDRFDPGRWLDDPRPPAARRDAYIPFAAGRRKCVGDQYALTEAAVALAAIGARWRIRPLSTAAPRPLARATLTPGRVLVVTEPRRPGRG